MANKTLKTHIAMDTTDYRHQLTDIYANLLKRHSNSDINKAILHIADKHRVYSELTHEHATTDRNLYTFEEHCDLEDRMQKASRKYYGSADYLIANGTDPEVANFAYQWVWYKC